MTKMTAHQASVTHFAAAVREWRGKRFSDTSIRSMLTVAMEYVAVHRNVQNDIGIVFEIANGQRSA